MQINIYKDKMLGARLFGASVLYSAHPIPREDLSAPVIKCKKTLRKKCSFVAEVKGKG